MTRLDRIAHDYQLALQGAIDSIVPQLNDALTHLRTIGRHADGYGTSSDEPIVSSGAETTSTERAGQLRYLVGTQIEELRDHVHAFHGLNRDLMDCIKGAWKITSDLPPVVIAEQSLCKEGGWGKEGGVVWHDPDCERVAVRHGLCDMHRMRWVRWKRDHGIDTTGDYEASA